MGTAHTQDSNGLTLDQWRDVLHRMVPYAQDDPLRRRAPRHGVTAMLHARLAYKKSGGLPCESMVLLTQVSIGGLTLRGRERVREDTDVRVELQLGPSAVVLNGRVVHCTQTLAAYKIGIQLRFAADE
ncbi:MAG: PilZ domain-containing protein [Phycisphaerae bacterium]|nr:PilZ domain-containing protein [Phycisphaerae bacterium]